MADNTEEKYLADPTNNQSENSTEEITPTADTETINPNQESENMEVHHHTHPSHGKKTWKNYFDVDYITRIPNLICSNND